MQDLIHACRSLSFQSSAAVADVEELVERDFPAKFGIPYGWSVMLSGADSKMVEPLKGLVDELVQHLVDLNYLPARFYDDYHQNVGEIMPPVFSKLISDAVKEYFNEDDALADAGLTVDDLDWDDLIVSNDVLTIVVQRLNLLTSLDGECTIDAPIQLGDKGIFSRVLHYRLDAFGLFLKDDNIAAPISQQTIIQTLKMNLLIGRKKHNEINFDVGEISPVDFALTGNVHVLFKEFSDSHDKKMLVYHCPKEGVEPVADYDRLIVFKDKFIFDKNDKKFKREVRKNNLDFDQVQQHIATRGGADSESNTFGTRLLQLKLWMFGFYFGRIDGRYQDLSHEAYQDLLEQEEKPRKHDDFMLPLDQGFWAVNLPKTADLFSEYDEKLDRADALENQLIEAIPEDSEENFLQSNIEGRSGEVASFLAEGRKRKRRIYHGIKSIIASATKGIKRIGKWIKKQVEKVSGAVVSFFKNITKRIREGVTIFYRALRRFTIFILRKPIISPENFREMPPATDIVMTRFDLDSDVTIAQSDKLPQDVKQSHSRLIRGLTFGLRIFLEIAGQVISIIRNLSSPIGWIRLGVRIGKLVGELLNLRIRLPRVGRVAVPFV